MYKPLQFVVELASPHTLENPFLWSSVLTAIAFFFIGALKTQFVVQKLWWGAETLGVGGLAASIAYAVGTILKSVV